MHAEWQQRWMFTFLESPFKKNEQGHAAILGLWCSWVSTVIPVFYIVLLLVLMKWVVYFQPDEPPYFPFCF